ncbi:HAD family hydrolase [Asaia lannensis]|uniref:phosphoglycolate phosphatase n=1 Tax=Asaia lannensis NBRC 102526 TaxID=1307926 RepID=A0ABT1CF76_9PROT|nr:HAD-IA family hydrolase [Asaia lannensis]MCO6159396.1 HAD-IA family hydrolase [Asaia lannensis NBRC 102526]GBQ98202.1 phosphoglycolate phosphatase [Asaia lannensis NBRC 102526]
MSTEIETAVFDLDGTLIDSLPDLAESGIALLETYGLPQPDEAAIRSMIGDGARKLVDRLLISGGDKDSIDRDEATRRFLDIYEPRATEKTRPFPDVEATLTLLHKRGISCVICTNKPLKAAQAIIEKLGLSPLIDAIGGGDSFPVRKPDPDHIRKTMRLIGAEPMRGIMIGDHRNDIQAASGVPMPSLFASWGYGDRSMSAHASAIAGSVAELPRLIYDLSRPR